MISKIYIDRQVENTPPVQTVQERLGIPAEVVSDATRVYREVAAAPDPIQKGKQVLYLTRNQGSFIRKCPGTRHYTCCGYQILHIGTYCSMDCSYCILQSYFHPPVLQYFVNHRDMSAELDRLFSHGRVRRVGTGEFTDSLIWDPWTDLSAFLVPQFSVQTRTALELKTKTANVRQLKMLQHNRKTIVAWSLNTDPVIRYEERRTATRAARLEAAAQCESWGYPLAFHFDPLIIYEGCESDYRRVVEELFSRVSPDNVVWISLGSFRFMPELKTIIQQRFADSKIVYGEFISGLDGKMRYFKPLRIALYRRLAEWIRAIAPNVLVYFCMEDDEVWQKSLGFLPAERGGLPAMLDEQARRHCGLD